MTEFTAEYIKKNIAPKLVVGAAVRIGAEYAEAHNMTAGEVLVLIKGQFEHDNGLYTEGQTAPSVWNEQGQDFDSIYHLFGNNLESFGDCEVIEEKLSDTDQIIRSLFSSRWSGDLSRASIEDMRQQLHKTLRDKVAGYWSGHTAYHLSVDGGFLIDSKRVIIESSNMAKGKTLTALGEMFMASMVGSDSKAA